MASSVWQPATYVPPLPFFFINVMSEGAVGDGVTNDTAVFNNAFSKGKFVYAPPGDYLLGNVNIPTGGYLFGAGMANTIFRQAPSPVGGKGVIFANSGSASSFLEGIVLQDFTVIGRSQLDPFNEFYHLISLNGVRNCVVQRVFFSSFSGDGLYLGSGDTAGQERHNFNVSVRDCYFDGVNYENRNAISVIDGDGVFIEGNTFYRCVKSTMPGAVDIEPDQTWHVVKNIRVSNNKFKAVGGNIGVVSCVMAGSIPAPLNISITDNQFEDSLTSVSHAEIAFQTNRILGDSSDFMNIVVAQNTGANGCKPFDIRSVKGLVFESNQFDDYSSNSLLGYIASSDLVRDATFDSNHFRRIGAGASTNYGIAIFNVNSVTLERNNFDDCGDGTAGSCAINFGQGSSTRVKLLGNVYRAPTGRTLQATVKEASHTFAPLTNTQMDEVFLNNLANNFQALETNNGWQTYTPVVAGATIAGTGTYTKQVGYWRREGNLIHFLIDIGWNSAAHSGTGICRISLPAIAYALPGNPLLPVGAVYPAVVSSLVNGEVVHANLNDQAIVNGVQGCVQLAKQLGAVTAGLVLPFTADIRIRGMYEARVDVMV